MKGKRILLATCVFAMILSIGANIAWAGKPAKYHTEYGYAELADESGYDIWSDNGGPYTDKNKGGKDEVWFEVYDDGTNKLKKAVIFMGKPEVPYNSDRKVNLQFDIDRGVKTAEYANNEAVYQILRYTRDNFGSSFYIGRGNPPGVLNDGSVHARVTVAEVDAGYAGQIQFVVDPGYDATLPQAINQSAVDALAAQEGLTNGPYWTTDTEGYGHIIYNFYYSANFDVIPESPTDGNLTWTITPQPGSVKLAILRCKNSAIRRIVNLSTYDALPFKITLVSLGRLTTAPKKVNNISTTWGMIKERF